jgi:hypothetical protein
LEASVFEAYRKIKAFNDYLVQLIIDLDRFCYNYSPMKGKSNQTASIKGQQQVFKSEVDILFVHTLAQQMI